MRGLFALFHYIAAAFFLYAAYVSPGWEECSTGFPSTDAGITAALLVTVAMASKLMGHVWLFSTARAKKGY